MPKAYWVAHADVHDPDPYALYIAGAARVFEAYGAVILARGGATEKLEGTVPDRNVVIEFDSLERALACYQSAEYQAAKRHRDQAGEVTLLIVEGV